MFKLFFISLTAISFNLFANEINIVSVHDGDTVTYIQNNVRYKGRLKYIDAPELKQEFGITSKLFLENYLKNNKPISIIEHGQDVYHRKLITLIDTNDNNINQLMIETGNAWAYDKKFREQQNMAKLLKFGLWNTQNPINPKVWRKETKLSNTKIKCSDIKTCDEAMYFLTKEKQTSLDANGDGIPCETLCKKK